MRQHDVLLLTEQAAPRPSSTLARGCGCGRCCCCSEAFLGRCVPSALGISGVGHGASHGGGASWRRLGAVQLSGTWCVGAPHASQHTAVVTTRYRVNVGCKRGVLGGVSRPSARTHMDSNTKHQHQHTPHTTVHTHTIRVHPHFSPTAAILPHRHRIVRCLLHTFRLKAPSCWTRRLAVRYATTS